MNRIRLSRMTLPLAVLLELIVVPVHSESLPRESALSSIAAIESNAKGATLELALPSATGDEVPAGSSRQIRIDATEAGFLTLLHLDSNGALEIWVDGGEEQGELFPSTPRLLPDPTAPFSEVVQALMGDSTILAIQTPSPLEPNQLRVPGSAESSRFVFQSEAGALLERLRSHLEAMYGSSYSVARLNYRISPSAGDMEVTADQVVAFFDPDCQNCTRGKRPDDPFPVRIHFGVDSAQIDGRSRKTLDEIGKGLSRENMKRFGFEIAGHTDDQGEVDYNYRLGAKRAEAVRDFLKSKYGISASRLSTKSLGESKARATNASEAGRYDNRRVEFVLVK